MTVYRRIPGVFLLLAGCVATLQAGEPIGCVKSAQGEAAVMRGGAALPAASGQYLEAGDALRTGKGAALAVILLDGTRISLGPSSQLELKQFVYEPARKEMSLVLRLAQGVAAFVSGRIGRLMPQAVKVETPTAVVGLRGTQFVIRLAEKQVTP